MAEVTTLRGYLSRRAITQEEFAEKIQISRQALFNLITWKSQPSLATALRIHIATNGIVPILNLLPANIRKEIEADSKEVGVKFYGFIDKDEELL